MTEFIENKEIKERVILIGISTGDGEDAQASLQELSELVKTAGADAIDQMIQKREAAHPATYLGKGKMEDLGNRRYGDCLRR